VATVARQLIILYKAMLYRQRQYTDRASLGLHRQIDCRLAVAVERLERPSELVKRCHKQAGLGLQR